MSQEKQKTTIQINQKERQIIMKRFLIGLVAVAGLVASVLAVATSTANPTSGQSSGTIILENIGGTYPDPFGQLRTAAGVTVTVATVGGCDAGNLAPSNNGVFSLPGQGTPGGPNAIASTGLLNPRCSWTVSAVNPGDSCAVDIILRESDGTEIGRESDGSVTLSGLNTGRLVYGASNTAVTNIAFFVNVAISTEAAAGLNAIEGVSGHSASPGNCVQLFQSRASITVPGTGSNGVSAYAGIEFTVAYSSTQTGCIATGADTFVVGRTLSSTTPPTATVGRKTGTTQPSLISRTRAEAARGAVGAYCRYTANVTPVLPENTNLGRSSFSVQESVDGGAATTIANGVISGGSDVEGASPTKVYTVVAAYTAITVKIKVTTVFPSDEIFTTADRVDYTIGINAPCGGYLNLLPSGFGSQGDSASSQVFPGTTLVYGEDLRPLTVGVTDSRTYRVDAYADARGSRVCSVTVSERNGPDRCSVVGGESQTMSYSAGATELAFEFNHTCDAVATAGGDAADGGSGTPPAPPNIGLGDENTDEATPVGPPTDAFTG